MTHRQFTTWQAWLDLDMLIPRRGDLYVAQASAAVSRVLHKKPRTVKLEHAAGEVNAFVERQKKAAPEQTPKQKVAAAKARALAAVPSGRFVHRIVDRDGNVLSEAEVGNYVPAATSE